MVAIIRSLIVLSMSTFAFAGATWRMNVKNADVSVPLASVPVTATATAADAPASPIPSSVEPEEQNTPSTEPKTPQTTDGDVSPSTQDLTKTSGAISEFATGNLVLALGTISFTLVQLL